jgi:hypothetical protein
MKPASGKSDTSPKPPFREVESRDPAIIAAAQDFVHRSVGDDAGSAVYFSCENHRDERRRARQLATCQIRRRSPTISQVD